MGFRGFLSKGNVDERAGIFLLATMSLLAIVTACSCGTDNPDGMAYCAKGQLGCKCQNTSFTLDSGESPVSSCSPNTIGRPMQCCYDLAADGTTTSCECFTYDCVVTNAGATSCLCEWLGAADTRSQFTQTCSPGREGTCCDEQPVGGGPFHVGSCVCTTPPAGPSSGACDNSTHMVSTCGAPPVALDCSGRHGPVTSCDGLNWKPPSSGMDHGGGGGNCTMTGGSCGGDVDCCPGHRCRIDLGYATGSCS